ncbi:putative ABC-type transporter, periplasmic component [Flavimobilis marinus]|uniref:D-methionine transport system substrate-binding protein n=1 Tax=Flavimobilis marinus TaxID=285351 RepID=A0A1I2CL64_9MICO|nr:MetQ/NlpA family ABC transporter substrate-binding protein [Flavimobilis marinus]GHG47494.1 putative ABC-type transporter, periplasmic component [Flavimobilis marinus]SFE68533.1 D-methionine transport system substrate-binding protein [Flavimobilis marinus]
MKRTTLSVLALTSLALGLTACASEDETPAASGSGTSSAAEAPVRIGVVNSSDEQWPIFVEKATEAGIEVELVNFTEYTQPNPALSQDQLDLNQFQHLQYLADYNVAAGDTLTPIGSTAIYPLALYSAKHDSVEAIPEGGEIAVPNDPTNLNRALFVLQSAGLVELEGGGTLQSTEIDVLPSSKVTVTPVDAAQAAVALQSVDGAIINNDFLEDAGLAADDALAQDDPASVGARPYINIWVAREEDKDNETYLELVEISHDAEVEAALQQASGGTAVIVDEDGATLAGYLADIQAAIAQG